MTKYIVLAVLLWIAAVPVFVKVFRAYRRSASGLERKAWSLLAVGVLGTNIHFLLRAQSAEVHPALLIGSLAIALGGVLLLSRASRDGNRAARHR